MLVDEFDLNFAGEHIMVRFSDFSNLHWATFTLDGELVKKGADYTCLPTTEELDRMKVCIKTFSQKIARSEFNVKNIYYIRYGDLPTGKYSRNYVTNQSESGVSVYGARYNVMTEAFELLDVTCAGTLFEKIMGGVEPALYSGDCVGVGSDGEPVLEKSSMQRICGLTYVHGVGLKKVI